MIVLGYQRNHMNPPSLPNPPCLLDREDLT